MRSEVFTTERALLWANFVVITGVSVSCMACSSDRRRRPIPQLGVTSTEPQAGAVHVGPDTPISATFDRELDPASIDEPNAVRVEDAEGQQVEGTRRLLEPDTVLFTPNMPLAGATDYRLILGPPLRGQDGTGLVQEQVVSFRTRSTVPAGALLINEIFPAPDAGQQFIEVVNVWPEALNLRGIQIGTQARPEAHTFGNTVLPSGAAFVVWGQSPGGTGNVQASSEALELSSQGDEVVIRSTERDEPLEIDRLLYPDEPNAPAPRREDESINRLFDAEVGDQPGIRFVHHLDVSGAALPVSPGTRVNGNPYPTFGEEPIEEEPIEEEPIEEEPIEEEQVEVEQ